MNQKLNFFQDIFDATPSDFSTRDSVDRTETAIIMTSSGRYDICVWNSVCPYLLKGHEVISWKWYVIQIHNQPARFITGEVPLWVSVIYPVNGFDVMRISSDCIYQARESFFAFPGNEIIETAMIQRFRRCTDMGASCNEDQFVIYRF